MSINATLLAQMLVFGLLVWFSMTFVWPMLLKQMQLRETRISDGLAAAEKGQRSLEDAEAKTSAMLQEGREKAQEFVVQAQKRGDDIIEESKTKAREEGERLIQSARAQIEQERNQARDALRSEVAVLAIQGAERILQREVNPEVHSEALGKLAASL